MVHLLLCHRLDTERPRKARSYRPAAVVCCGLKQLF
jgi:hypothetical protein